MGTTETAVLGGGCFWCLEAVYHELRGVQAVISGYAGGSVAIVAKAREKFLARLKR